MEDRVPTRQQSHHAECKEKLHQDGEWHPQGDEWHPFCEGQRTLISENWLDEALVLKTDDLQM